jgi:mitogen-activated protein kinase 1/3
MDHLFIVMDVMKTDFEKLMDAMPQTELSEEHILIILYNQLCSLNFIHSANIIHRDLKPANFLVDS